MVRHLAHTCQKSPKSQSGSEPNLDLTDPVAQVAFLFPHFKALVWTSNVGGLILMVIGLELLIVTHAYTWAMICFIAGVTIALFPSNYEIVGMEPEESQSESDSE